MDGWTAVRGPLLSAHRGHHVRWPENSLPAFRAAHEHGADALELDVHLTRDGVPVVCHDPTGARVAGVHRAIAACTLAEVKTWALSGAPREAEPVRLPSFEELLAALPGALLNVDLKQRDPDPVVPMLRLIARHGAEARVLLTSFDAAVLRRVRAAGYPGPVGLARSEAVRAVVAPRALWRLWPLRAARLQIPTRFGPLNLARPEVIARAHDRGLAIDYWVVDDPAEAAVLLEAGADGLVTDHLDELAPVYARAPVAAAWRARHGALAIDAGPG